MKYKRLVKHKLNIYNPRKINKTVSLIGVGVPLTKAVAVQSAERAGPLSLSPPPPHPISVPSFSLASVAANGTATEGSALQAAD